MAGLAMLLLAASGGDAQLPAASLVSRLERLADAGHAEATYHLAMSYHLGLGVDKDPARALDLFRKAAALGDPLGAYKLGCYYDGQGEGLVTADPVTALRHKLVAAEAGYALAQQDVAALHARQGDMAQALVWIERAAKQGWPDALSAMAAMYNGNNGRVRDPAMMAGYFRLFLATRGGGSEAQKQWLEALDKGMSDAERQRAGEIMRSFRPDPSPLTRKGLSGQKAAEALVAGRGD